jgi:exopolysaccharide biosynthesis polyprenyl glycosylphosphotransferase
MDFIEYMLEFRIISFIKKWRLLNLTLGLLDILSIAAAFQLSYTLNYSTSDIPFFFINRDFLVLFLAVLPFWLILMYFIHLTEIPRTKRYRVLFFEYLQSAVLVTLTLMLMYFIFKMTWISRLFLIEISALGFVFLFGSRIIEYKVFKNYRAKGYNYINVALVVDYSAFKIVDKLVENPEWGYRIVALFTDSRLYRQKYAKSIIIIPDTFIDVIYDLMSHDIVDEVLFIKNKIDAAAVRNIVRSCEELGVTFRLHYQDNKVNLSNAVKAKIASENFLTFINIPHKQYALAFKRFIDIIASAFALILLSPFLLLIAILVKATSKGPVIYVQERVGLRGRPFNLYKFRTMVANADAIRQVLDKSNEADGPVFKIRNDPRVTKIGGFLRKTGLDELPQLINIIKGEMSLIGPRPPIKEETLKYQRWQLRRLSVKPGLSCFWQIKPERNSIKFEKWMELDLAYIDNWSLRLDFLIMIKTVITIFKRTGL